MYFVGFDLKTLTEEAFTVSFYGIEPNEVNISGLLWNWNLSGEKNSSHTHKTGSWYLLAILIKVPTSTPVSYNTRVRLRGM